MKVGIPKEIKNNEFRIAIVPSGVSLLVQHGHRVLIETNAGAGSGIADADFKKVGATMVDRAKEVWKKADMIYKVKEPLPEEYALISEDHIFFTYFHFASSEELTRAMIERKAICVAYETVETDGGKLPLLEPMSEVAGRLSIQEGAKYLERPMGGRGVLLGGVPGVEPAEVLVIGGGAVGAHAARMAAGLGARVTILDINVNRLRYLADVMPPNVTTMFSSEFNIRQKIKSADLVVGAVLIAGAKAPKLITRDMLRTMKRGAVIVDVAIDQGGCTETSRPTTHSEPIYEVAGVIHYCVANMPGAVSRTSTFALTNATISYAVKLADKDFPGAIMDDEPLRKGVNMVHGKVTNKPVADAFNLPYTPIEKLLK